MDSAKELIQRIRKGDVRNGCTMRDIYLKHWTKLTTLEEVQKGIDILILYGWLRLEEIKTPGRPKQIIKIHPKLIVKEKSEDT